MPLSNSKEIWQTALGELQLQVTRPYYETYLHNTIGLDNDDGRFVIGVPTSFGVEWLNLRMRTRVEETLRGILKRPVSAQFVVCQNPKAHGRESQVDAHRARTQTQGNVYSEDPSDAAGAMESSPPFLNAKYTFSTLVMGDFNRMAYTASQSVAESPGKYYNPLFIYGSPGLGKTHLLHAIAHACIRSYKKPLYISAEQFTNDLAMAARDKSYQRFRDKYRRLDILLVDDIHFISGKQQTQEGFYHTFNYLHNASKQIVIAGDCHPREIPGVENRLLSRFEGGLLVDIQSPDLDAKLAIVQAKAQQQNIQLEPGVPDLIISQSWGSVRHLEGAFNRVAAFTRAHKGPVTPDVASQALDGLTPSPVEQLSPTVIIDRVAEHFNLDREDLQSKKREKAIVEARDVAIYLMRQELSLTPMQIGALLGHRTPTAVLQSHRKISNLMKSNPKQGANISSIRESFYSLVAGS